MDREAAAEAESAGRRPPAAIHRPQFAAQELGLTPAQRGTALHLAMQHLDFSNTGSRQALEAELKRLAALELLTEQQAEAVELERLERFFVSPLGRTLREAEGLRREFKFSLLVPAADYYPGVPAGEQVLLQGVVDCWFETPEGLVLVDFKTDRVGPGQLAGRAEEYRGQLTAYSRALEEITGKRVARRVLWFFAVDQEFVL
ncbi:ATP-dependent helicase/nuclease subunit A [bioreactor metagenome]|uniref:ATP-dependent helicase/nuclease subunit A n=1 Tax=bioreactor metagenome TaxID=1076179 RepID=A0A645HTN1_9ZZZZ